MYILRLSYQPLAIWRIPWKTGGAVSPVTNRITMDDPPGIDIIFVVAVIQPQGHYMYIYIYIHIIFPGSSGSGWNIAITLSHDRLGTFLECARNWCFQLWLWTLCRGILAIKEPLNPWNSGHLIFRHIQNLDVGYLYNPMYIYTYIYIY